MESAGSKYLFTSHTISWVAGVASSEASIGEGRKGGGRWGEKGGNENEVVEEGRKKERKKGR